ncbi:MAG: prepilin peptidase [Bacillota bacterium]
MNSLGLLVVCGVGALLGALLPTIAYAWIAIVSSTRPVPSLWVRLACAATASITWLGLWKTYQAEWPRFVLYANASLVLICCSIVDLVVWLIPNMFLVYGALSTLMILLTLDFSNLAVHLCTSLAAGLFFAGANWLSRGGMGLGDVKMSAVIGLVLGPAQSVVAFILAVFAGAATGLALMLARGSGFKERIAFGPFLTLGCITSMVWSEQIIAWYLRLWGIA